MPEPANIELLDVEREIVQRCEQLLELNDWLVTWHPTVSNRMLIEKRANIQIPEIERTAELVAVKKYLTDVIGMSVFEVENAVSVYDEKVIGNLPYISGIEVSIDSRRVLAKHNETNTNA